ncbi:MAG: hypothetical protein P4L84_34935 [Isosphaeraceae bacterium]|nr:hypothetical protein [Isosphaeraceae bacterium]
MPEHTPTPWQSHNDEYAPFEIIGNVDTMADASHQFEPVCTIEEGPHAHGNRTLILAAPGMLTELRLIADYLEAAAPHLAGSTMTPEAALDRVRRARTAIAKAESYVI